MSRRLDFIVNASLSGKETKEDWDSIQNQLKRLNIERARNHKGIEDEGNWEYRIAGKVSEPDFCVEFLSPYPIELELYKGVAVIPSIYNYSILYQNFELNWFADFRKNLFNVVRIIGATEGIFLHDLSEYITDFAMEGESYQKIKEQMITDLGKPITDYQLLIIKEDDPEKNWFLEKFK